MRKVRTLPYHTRPKQKARKDELAVMVNERWFQDEVEAVVNNAVAERKAALDTDSDNPDLISSSDDSDSDVPVVFIRFNT